jgi:hypothetical protein
MYLHKLFMNTLFPLGINAPAFMVKIIYVRLPFILLSRIYTRLILIRRLNQEWWNGKQENTCRVLVQKSQVKTELIGFDILTEVVMKSYIWDTTPWSPLKVNRRFGGTCWFLLQGWRIIQARNLRQASSKQSHCWFFAWIILWPWRRRRHVSPKRQLTFNGLRGVIS